MRILLILLAVILASCSIFSDAETDPAFLRVQNASDIDFSNVVIQFTEDQVQMGSVESGQYSAYQPFDIAYRYGMIEVESGDETYQLVPFDYAGEQPLESGHYTYQLNIENGNLLLEFLEDGTDQ